MVLALNIDWNNLLSGLIGAIVGGVIALIASIWSASKSATKAFEYSRDLQREAEKEQTRRFLLAIKAEIETFWSSYQSAVGDRVEKLGFGEGFPLPYRMGRDFFTVYNINAQYLGHVEDDALRNAIVRTYALAKGLVDVHGVNNDFLANLNTVSSSTFGYTQVKNAWEEFGSEIRLAYEKAKESVRHLLELLNNSTALKE